MVVSSEYDQKEQFSRNLLRALGVFSEPSLSLQVISGTHSYNLTLLWVDPIGSLADVSDAFIDETASVSRSQCHGYALN